MSECLSGVKDHSWLFGCLSETHLSCDSLSLDPLFPFDQTNNELPLITVWFTHPNVISRSVAGLNLSHTDVLKKTNTKDKLADSQTQQTGQLLCGTASLLAARLSALLLSTEFLKVCVIMEVMMGGGCLGLPGSLPSTQLLAGSLHHHHRKYHCITEASLSLWATETLLLLHKSGIREKSRLYLNTWIQTTHITSKYL